MDRATRTKAIDKNGLQSDVASLFKKISKFKI